MKQNVKISKGLSGKENELDFCIQGFLFDRKAQNLSKNTVIFYNCKMGEFYKYCLSQEVNKVMEISPDLIRRFLLFLEEKGHNEGGIHAFYRVVKTFLNFFENEYEPENWKNPIRKVKAPRVTIEPIEGISKKDVYKLVDVCKKRNFYGERDKAILLTLLDTGIRASELCGINLEDLDFSDNSLLITQGKGRKPRNVFIGRATRKQIKTYLKYRGYDKGALFTNRNGDRLGYFTLRQIVRRLAEKVGIPEPGLHNFRRTFALESLRGGIDIQSLSRLMGHSDLQVLSRYLKQTKEDLRQVYKSVVDNGL